MIQFNRRDVRARQRRSNARRRWLSASPYTRWAILMGAAAGGILLSALWAATLPCQYRAHATFEYQSRSEQNSIHDRFGQFIAAARVTATAPAFLQDMSDEDRCNLLDNVSILDALTTAGTREITLAVTAAEPSLAQSAATEVAKAFIASDRQKDPYVIACAKLDKAQDEWREAQNRWTSADHARHDRAIVKATGVSASNTPSQDGASPEPSTLQVMPALMPAGASTPMTLAEQSLCDCKEQRARLAATYTARHPAVVSLDRRIRHLEQQVSDAHDAAGTRIGTDAAAPATVVPSVAESERFDEAMVARKAAYFAWRRAEDEFKRCRFEAPVLAYGEVEAGPQPIRFVGYHRRLWFLMASVLLVGAVLAWEIGSRRWAKLVPAQVNAKDFPDRGSPPRESNWSR